MRKTLLFLLIASLALIVTGCGAFSSKNTGAKTREDPRAMASQDEPKQESYEDVNFYYDFEDVLIPKELSLEDEESFVFETIQFKTGMLVFEGGVDHLSLVDFFIQNMAKDNWRKKISLKSDKSILVFEKTNKSCIIKVTDESFSSTRAEVLVVELKPGEHENIKNTEMQSRELPK